MANVRVMGSNDGLPSFYLGCWCIGRCTKSTDGYIIYCYLPGLRDIYGKYETVELAIEAFKEKTDLWVSEAEIGR